MRAQVRTAPHWQDETGLVTAPEGRVASQSATGCCSRQRWELSLVAQQTRDEAVGTHPDGLRRDPRGRPSCRGKNRPARCPWFETGFHHRGTRHAPWGEEKVAAEVPSSPRICLLVSSHHPVRREGDAARIRGDHVGRCDQALGPGGPFAPSWRSPWCSHFHVCPWLKGGQYILC